MNLDDIRAYIEQHLGAPGRDRYDLPESTVRFPDGAHFRTELLVPDLLHRGGRSAWEQAGAPGLAVQARERVRRILAEHRPPPLADQVARQLDEIVTLA